MTAHHLTEIDRWNLMNFLFDRCIITSYMMSSIPACMLFCCYSAIIPMHPKLLVVMIAAENFTNCVTRRIMNKSQQSPQVITNVDVWLFPVIANQHPRLHLHLQININHLILEILCNIIKLYHKENACII